MPDPVPMLLASNRPAERFYRGGRRITDFRGVAPAAEREPEDWVASTTTLAGNTSVGLSTLSDGRTLVEAISADPLGWLGVRHVERYGEDPMLLVKLLDAGERLPVHAHPDRAFARHQLGRSHGKAEAWFMLRDAVVHLGLQRDVSAPELAALVESQDSDTLLGLLHRVELAAGDTVFIPAGMPHAIAEGAFLVELQEPEDLSILLEWRDFALDGARDGHLGLGFDTALRAIDRTALSTPALERLVRPASVGASVLSREADEYFQLERVLVPGAANLEPGFGVLIVIDGELQLLGATPLPLPRGSTVVMPHSAGPMRLRGRGEVVVCRPPAS